MSRDFGKNWAQRIDHDFLGSPEQFSSLPWVVRVISTGMAPAKSHHSSSAPSNSATSSASSSSSSSASANTNAFLSEADKARFRRLERRKQRKQRQAPNSSADPSSVTSTTDELQKDTATATATATATTDRANAFEAERFARESRLMEDRALLVQQSDVVSASAATIVSQHGEQLGKGLHTLHQKLCDLSQAKRDMQAMRARVANTQAVLSEGTRNVTQINRELETVQKVNYLLEKVEYVRQTIELVPYMIEMNDLSRAALMMKESFDFLSSKHSAKLSEMLPRYCDNDPLKSLKESLLIMEKNFIHILMNKLSHQMVDQIGVLTSNDVTPEKSKEGSEEKDGDDDGDDGDGDPSISIKHELIQCIELVQLVQYA